MNRRHAPDYRFLGAVGVLLVFGLVMLSSAGSVIGLTQFEDTYYFLKRQFLVGVIPGLLFGYIILRRDYRELSRFAILIFAGCIALLILVFVPGIGLSYGTFAHRWIALGPINFQPSEIVKLGFIIFLASWLTTHRDKIKNLKEGFLPFLLLLGTGMGLIILQPDLGTASVIVLIGMVLFFVGGGRVRHIGLLLLGGMLLLALLVYLEPYRAERFTIFLHPERDPLGIGYHINQSFLAVGSGGWWGRGFGHSRAKFQYLPEATGDSIFAVIAEELGFIPSVALILLVAYIFLRGLRIARFAADDFGRYVAVGITTWFTGQALVNISAMIGLLPLTGIPFPFVSYGGTALAVALIGVGIMGSISAYGKET